MESNALCPMIFVSTMTVTDVCNMALLIPIILDHTMRYVSSKDRSSFSVRQADIPPEDFSHLIMCHTQLSRPEDSAYFLQESYCIDPNTNKIVNMLEYTNFVGRDNYKNCL